MPQGQAAGRPAHTACSPPPATRHATAGSAGADARAGAARAAAGDDSVAGRSLDDLNRDSPLRPVFFDYDSSDVNDAGRAMLQANAGVLKKYSVVGHYDRRPLRRTRNGGVQSGAWRTTRRRGANLPGLARHRREPRCGPSATAASSRSIRRTRRPRGAGTAARIL